MKNAAFVPDVCPHCTQTTNYEMTLDRGTALIVLAIANAVRRLGRNRVHVADEMLAQHDGGRSFAEMVGAGYMTPKMYTNVSRARRHGLVAFAEGRGGGEYLLTRKGAAFLRGELVPRMAVVSKVTGHNSGYWPEGGTVRVGELLKRDAPMWAGAIRDSVEYLGGQPEEFTPAMV